MIPKTLAVNAAKDSTDLVAKLRAYHSAAQKAPAGDPKKALMHYGLDLVKGDARDNLRAGILEPTISKVRSLKSAYETAVSLLRIDDSLQVAPGKQRPGLTVRHALTHILQSKRRRRTRMGTESGMGFTLASDLFRRPSADML